MTKGVPPPDAPLDTKIEWCISEIIMIEQQLSKTRKRNPGPWYVDGGVWFGVLLLLMTIGAVYLFVISEQGWTILLPEWMKR